MMLLRNYNHKTLTFFEVYCKHSTQLHLVLYLSLDTPPRAVFSIQTHGSALSNISSTLSL